MIKKFKFLLKQLTYLSHHYIPCSLSSFLLFPTSPTLFPSISPILTSYVFPALVLRFLYSFVPSIHFYPLFAISIFNLIHHLKLPNLNEALFHSLFNSSSLFYQHKQIHSKICTCFSLVLSHLNFEHLY